MSDEDCHLGRTLGRVRETCDHPLYHHGKCKTCRSPFVSAEERAFAAGGAVLGGLMAMADGIARMEARRWFREKKRPTF